MKLQRTFFVSIVLFVAAIFNFTEAQVNTTAAGYKIGSAKKQIYPDNTYSFFSNEPQDFGVLLVTKPLLQLSVARPGISTFQHQYLLDRKYIK